MSSTTTITTADSDPDFQLNDAFLVVAITISSLCILRILVDFCLNKSAREIPTGLMAVRAIFNYIAVMVVLVTLKLPTPNLKHNKLECQLQGAVFLFCLYIATVYYGVICVELAWTLKNPFRAPSSGSKLFHITAILICFLINLAIALAKKFEFRPLFQICFMEKKSAKSSRINLLNWFLIYIPVFGICLLGIIATIWSVRRLLSGINHDTFASRMLAIKQQIAIITCFTINYVLQGVNWFILFTLKGTDADYKYSPYLLSVFCLIACIFDVITWTVRKHIDHLPQIPISSSVRLEKRSVSESYREATEIKKVKNISDALRKEVITFIIDGLSHKYIETRRESELTPISHHTHSVSIQDPNDYHEALLPNQHKGHNREVHERLLFLSRYYPENLDDKCVANVIEQFSIDPPKVSAQPIKGLFTNYAPKVFTYLRGGVYGVSDESYYESIRPIHDVSKIALDLIANFSEGRSGAFLFFTKDMKYLIKTLEKTEAQLLLDTLKDYVAHMTVHRDTYLLKYYGLHSIKLYGHEIYFVVNNNIFSILNTKPDEKYDIKGSWVDRNTNHRIEDKKLMKDKDLKKPLLLERFQSAAIYKQLEDDTEFLSQSNIMDYSLLLGVYYSKVKVKREDEMKDDYSDDENDEEKEQRGVVLDAEVVEGAGKYIIGIIDMLQKWDANKKMERFVKTYVRLKDKDGVSCIPPMEYRDRFLNKMNEIGIGYDSDILQSVLPPV